MAEPPVTPQSPAAADDQRRGIHAVNSGPHDHRARRFAPEMFLCSGTAAVAGLYISGRIADMLAAMSERHGRSWSGTMAKRER